MQSGKLAEKNHLSNKRNINSKKKKNFKISPARNKKTLNPELSIKIERTDGTKGTRPRPRAAHATSTASQSQRRSDRWTNEAQKLEAPERNKQPKTRALIESEKRSSSRLGLTPYQALI